MGSFLPCFDTFMLATEFPDPHSFSVATTVTPHSLLLILFPLNIPKPSNSELVESIDQKKKIQEKNGKTKPLVGGIRSGWKMVPELAATGSVKEESLFGSQGGEKSPFTERRRMPLLRRGLLSSTHPLSDKLGKCSKWQARSIFQGLTQRPTDSNPQQTPSLLHMKPSQTATNSTPSQPRSLLFAVLHSHHILYSTWLHSTLAPPPIAIKPSHSNAYPTVFTNILTFLRQRLQLKYSKNNG